MGNKLASHIAFEIYNAIKFYLFLLNAHLSSSSTWCNQLIQLIFSCSFTCSLYSTDHEILVLHSTLYKEWNTDSLLRLQKIIKTKTLSTKFDYKNPLNNNNHYKFARTIYANICIAMPLFFVFWSFSCRTDCVYVHAHVLCPCLQIILSDTGTEERTYSICLMN